MKTLFECLIWIAIGLAILMIVASIIYMKWSAYFQRFPEAAWWSFFFN